MDFVIRIVLGISLMVVGLVLVVKTYRVVRVIGRNAWAEQHLGSGGTYALVKIIGIIAMLASVMFIFGIAKLSWFSF